MGLDFELSSSEDLLSTLADFRCELRQFLQFSEQAAEAVGVQPRQYQLLLQIAGAPAGARTTIAYAAERLSLRHNSVVELVDRSEREGLLLRAEDADDRRRVLLRLTPKGEELLNELATAHAMELYELAPRLTRSLKRLSTHGHSSPAHTAERKSQ